MQRASAIVLWIVAIFLRVSVIGPIFCHPNSNFVFSGVLSASFATAAAIGWFQRAADRMHMPAMWQLALVFNSGIGTAPDPARAMHWYRHDCMIV